jgi:gliding motility-associated-like protein
VSHVVNPLFSQYYKVNVEDSSGCESNYDSVLVALFPPIIINTLTDSICPFDSLDLSVIAFGGNGGPYNYSWTNQSGVQLSNQTTANVSPNNFNTYYYVSVSDICETPENNDSVLVTWYDLPNVDFSSDTSSGCWPLEVLFNNNTNVSQVASCEWNFGNGIFSNNLDTVAVIYNNPGSYHVTLQVTNSDGCYNDTTYFNFIDIYEYPVAGFISRPNPASILNPSVQFVDTSSSDVVYFDWTFYDSTNTIIGSDYVQNPTYNFSGIIEQQYYIQLYVENHNGCSDTVNGIQIVEGEYSFFLPNSFTPNGDGLNDSFFPVGDKVSIENYSFKIFNRWGEMIFNTNDFNAKWDGTYQNNPLSSDAYIWKIDLVDISTGKEKNLKGYVLLSR